MNTHYKAEVTVNGKKECFDVPYGEPSKDIEVLLNSVSDMLYLRSDWHGFTGFKVNPVYFKDGGLAFAYATFWARSGLWIRKIQVIVYWSGLNVMLRLGDA